MNTSFKINSPKLLVDVFKMSDQYDITAIIWLYFLFYVHHTANLKRGYTFNVPGRIPITWRETLKE